MKLSPEHIAQVTRGAVDVVEEDGGITFHRLTTEESNTYRDSNRPDLYPITFASADVRLAFRTDATALAFDYRTSYGGSEEFVYLDLWEDGVLTAHRVSEGVDNATHSARFDFSPGVKTVELYLPWNRRTVLADVDLVGATFFEPVVRRCKILCFGDSITQGGIARYSSLTYTNALARLLNADSLNKGVCGGVFFPQMLVEPVSFVPDLVTVAYGTNDWRGSTPESTLQRATDFLRRVSALYPSSPVYAISPLWRADSPDASKSFGKGIDFMEELIREACAGLPNVTVISGTSLVPHLPDFYSDQRLHPNDIGFCVYANALANRIVSGERVGTE